MGTWNRNAQGIWTLAGSGDTALMAGEQMPQRGHWKVHCTDPLHGVRLRILASKDGRSAWEIGVDEVGTGGDIFIRQVTFASAAAAVANDTHGIADGEPFILEARWADNVITGYINGVEIIDYTNDVAPTFEAHRWYGFVAGVAGAKVTREEIGELEALLAPRRDYLVRVVQGAIEYTADGVVWKTLKNGAFRTSGRVSLRELEQKEYGCDGSRTWVIDPAALTVTAYTATAGSLPGFTTAGTTTADLFEAFVGRIWMNDRLNPQNLTATAINDVFDLDTGDDVFGHAFSQAAQDLPRLGEPITCIKALSRSVMFVGTDASMWEFVADTALALPELNPLHRASGISGPDAITLVAGGRAVAHSPDGAFVIVPGAREAIPLSALVLTAGITIPREDVAGYTVMVAHDASRHLVAFYLTPVESGVATHIIYDERVGGYMARNGGFFPDTLPARLGPTAVSPRPWNGKVPLGTRDGFCYELSDETAEDDDGAAIDARFSVRIDEGDLTQDTILHKLVILLSDDSDDVEYRVWGGRTPEEAYGGPGRWLLKQGTARAMNVKPDTRIVRAPCLVLELANDTRGERMSVEDVQVFTTTGRLSSRRRRGSTAPEAESEVPVPDNEFVPEPGSNWQQEFVPVPDEEELASVAGMSAIAGPGSPPGGGGHGNPYLPGFNGGVVGSIDSPWGGGPDVQ